MLCVIAFPPLLIVAVTVSFPLFCARFRMSFPGVISLITANGPALHSVFKSPTPAACIALRFVTFGTTSIVDRPSHFLGAARVKTGSGIASLIVIAMSFVRTPSG